MGKNIIGLFNKKTILISGLIFLSICFVILSLLGTFASDDTVAQSDNIHDISITGSVEEVVVPANGNKTVLYQITNTNKGKVQYGVIYSGDNITAKVFYDSNDKESDLIDYGETKYVKLYIENSGSSESTATIKAVLGYEKGGTLNVPNLIPTGFQFVSEKFSPTAYAVYLEEDNSLRFFRSVNPVNVGDTYKGKEVTAVFTGFETSHYSSGTAPWYSYRESITSVLVEDIISPISTTGWFMEFRNCTKMVLTKLDTSNVTSMSVMFYGCSSLTSLDLSGFDTSKVTNMNSTFRGCTALTTMDVSTWDTSSITNMARMFQDCSSLTTLDVSNWDTSQVDNMEIMFQDCSSLTILDVSNWNTENVTNMYEMFRGCSALTTLGIGNWNTSSVKKMIAMFADCSSLTTLDVSNWDTSSVTEMSSMFYNCSNLITLDLSSWNTSNVTTTMASMFNGCSKLTTLDLSSWNTSNVPSMRQMFYGCSSLTTLDLSNFNTSNVTDMYQMFRGCNILTTIYVSDLWNTDNVTSSNNMFRYCYELVGGSGTVYSTSLFDKTYAKVDGGTNDPGYFTSKSTQS